MTCSLGLEITARRLSRLPVEQSSMTVTLPPSPSRRSTRCDPMKPAPPVTKLCSGLSIAFIVRKAGRVTQAGSTNLGLAQPGWPRHSPPGIRDLKIIVAMTGASGAIYTQRLLDNLDSRQHELHVVLSHYAQAVVAQELPEGLRLPPGTKTHSLKSMNAPFASGSNAFDAMVVIPCSMGTLGRIAHGTSEDVLLRGADVMLKERRKLILVPRETPLNLVHVKNFELLLQAGATILPANPCFYNNPKTIEEVVDTVVARVLDHLGVPQKLMPRWQEERE